MTDTILSQILAVRDTGLVNMCNCIAVQEIASNMNMNELVNYIKEDQSRYFNFILYGKESD